MGRSLGLRVLFLGVAACGEGDTEPLAGQDPAALCAGLTTEAACAANAACRPVGCPTCDGTSGFLRCVPARDAGRVACPIPDCPIECASLDEQACETSGACHRVYTEIMQPCDCTSVACCITYVGCADGAFADCRPPPCERAPPDCDRGFAPSSNGSCYEGCVLQADCGEP
jgi:hypothetical protein